jgi:hypothetical protein
MRILSHAEARSLPPWRRPVTLLFLMAAAMPVAFATCMALLDNFVVEVAGSAATLAAYGLIVLTRESVGPSFDFADMVSGGVTAVVALVCYLAYPQFESPHPQLRQMGLRRRDWLYDAPQVMSGARVGFEVHQVTALFLVNLLANMIFALALALKTYFQKSDPATSPRRPPWPSSSPISRRFSCPRFWGISG